MVPDESRLNGQSPLRPHLPQLLHLRHTPVLAHRSDQLTRPPRVARHQVVGAQRERAAVRGLVRASEVRQHQAEVEVGGGEPTAPPAGLVVGRGVAGDVFGGWVPEPREGGTV